MARISNNLIAILIIIFGITVSFNNWLIYENANQFVVTGFVSKTATVNLCFNNPPAIDLTCATTATVGTLYTCDVDATDKDNGDITFTDNVTIFDINANTGIISFTPTSSQTRTHVINIFATDDSGCANNFDSSILELTVNESAEEPETPAAPSGSGGGGIGAGGFITPLKKDFSLNKKIIKVSIFQGETKTADLQIKNTGDVKLKFSVEIQNLEKFIVISQDYFEIEPDETKTITISLTASETEILDVYSGRIVIKADEIEKNVITIIEVIERKALFDINIRVDEDYKEVLRAQEVKFIIDLINIGTLKPVDVELYYAIKDIDGNVINFKEETLAVGDKLSIKRSLNIPKYIKSDDYIVYGMVSYNNQTAISSDLFKVLEKPLISIKYDSPLTIAFGILTIILAIFTLINLGVYKAIRYNNKINEFLNKTIYRSKEKKKFTKEDTDKQLQILKADLEEDIITKQTYDKQKKKLKGLTKKEYDKLSQILKADLEEGIITKKTYDKQKKKIKDRLNETKS